MKKSITPKQIKATNRQLICRYIYENEKVSQQELSYELHLSRPTVAANLAELEADGLIYRNGQLESELIGRKAVAYSVKEDFRIAIGVEVIKKQIKMIAVNLYGRKIERQVLDLPYRNQEDYFEKSAQAVLSFAQSCGFRQEQILGVGFAIQGLISADGTRVVYGKILDNTGLTIDVYGRHLPWPCFFIHDPEGAALTELWYSPDLLNAFYVSLSRHLGGAMITNGKVHAGKHGHNATFEHIRVRPQGELCYCGQRGCVETVCSMQALLGDGEPEPFFEAVRSGEPKAAARWKKYLGSLAGLICTLHLVRDVDVILGGHLALFLTQEDVQYLYDRIRVLTPFEEADDYIILSKMPAHSITVGAALPFIRQFLDHFDEKDHLPPIYL